ncbi:hypothetical protein BD770DRAFT_378506 [Pilaira anomala]|nr:hypothetical protein BD770DRAFT_378506 [Pilaira anomala]
MQVPYIFQMSSMKLASIRIKLHFFLDCCLHSCLSNFSFILDVVSLFYTVMYNTKINFEQYIANRVMQS